MAEKLPFPIAVFLDTNILDALPEDLRSGELASLVSEAGRVILPDIVAREWLTHSIEKAANSLKDAAKCRAHLKQYDDSWVVTRDPKASELERNVVRTAVRRIRDANLRVASPPRLNARDLAKRASRRVPPFADRG